MSPPAKKWLIVGGVVAAGVVILYFLSGSSSSSSSSGSGPYGGVQLLGLPASVDTFAPTSPSSPGGTTSSPTGSGVTTTSGTTSIPPSGGPVNFGSGGGYIPIYAPPGSTPAPTVRQGVKYLQ